MAISKTYLFDKIKREFGHPFVRVELDDAQIDDNVTEAIKQYTKYAAGQATQEVFFTMPISAGVGTYTMPAAVTDVLEYDSDSSWGGGVNTLFTFDNFMHSTGMLSVTPGFSLINYHIALDFLETAERYIGKKYVWQFMYDTNELVIQPTPQANTFALIRAYKVFGTKLTDEEVNLAYFYDNDWIFKYASAACKVTLGMIRRKFASFQSIGTTGIALDGDALVNEGTAEMQALKEDLKDNQVFEGFPILMG